MFSATKIKVACHLGSLTVLISVRGSVHFIKVVAWAGFSSQTPVGVGADT